MYNVHVYTCTHVHVRIRLYILYKHAYISMLTHKANEYIIYMYTYMYLVRVVALCTNAISPLHTVMCIYNVPALYVYGRFLKWVQVHVHVHVYVRQKSKHVYVHVAVIDCWAVHVCH